MRFAGSAISDFMPGGIDSDAMVMNSGERTSKQNQASLMAESDVASKGIMAQGEVEAAGIIADAKAGLANAQGNAAIMDGIGGIISSGIGAIGKGGSSGSSVGSSVGSGLSGAYTSGLNIAGHSPSGLLQLPTIKW